MTSCFLPFFWAMATCHLCRLTPEKHLIGRSSGKSCFETTMPQSCEIGHQGELTMSKSFLRHQAARRRGKVHCMANLHGNLYGYWMHARKDSTEMALQLTDAPNTLGTQENPKCSQVLSSQTPAYSMQTLVKPQDTSQSLQSPVSNVPAGPRVTRSSAKGRMRRNLGGGTKGGLACVGYYQTALHSDPTRNL